MPGADAHLLALLRHNLAQLGLAGMPGESLVERAAAAIRRQLADGEPSLDDVAQALNIPNWTLQRRLRNHGCTYQELLLEVRRELALNYLKDREIQISNWLSCSVIPRSARFPAPFTAGWACRPASGGAATWRRAERHSSSGHQAAADAQVRAAARSRGSIKPYRGSIMAHVHSTVGVIRRANC